MFEPLVEDWLDSINERGYQAAFCNLLLAEGYELIHNTRHTPIEFGKDIIARSPDGAVCAFQLKGATSSRFSLAELRSVEQQLFQLATYALSHPNLPRLPPQRPFLVVNAEPDEDVHRAIDDLNATIRRNVSSSDGLGLWGKSQFRSMIQRHAESFFPSKLQSFNSFLRIYSSDGDGLLNLQQLSDVLDEVLDTTKQTSAAEAWRRLLTAQILTAIGARPFFASANHYSILTGFAYTALRCVAFNAKTDKPDKIQLARLLELAEEQIAASILALFGEASAAPRLMNSTGFLSDAALVPWRKQILVALFSSLYLSDRVQVPDLLDSLREWIDKNRSPFFIWGEGAVPAGLILYWWLHNVKPGRESEAFLSGFIARLTVHATRKGVRGLASTYIPFSRIVWGVWQEFLGPSEEGDVDDWCKFRSQFIYPLFLLLARTNSKQTCKLLWPHIVRAPCEYTKLDDGADFARFRVEASTRQTDILPDELTWSEVLERAKLDESDQAPGALFERPLLLLLYLLVMPHRISPSVVLKASRKIIRTWY